MIIFSSSGANWSSHPDGDINTSVKELHMWGFMLDHITQVVGTVVFLR